MNKSDLEIIEEIKKENEEFDRFMNNNIIDYYLYGGFKPFCRMEEVGASSAKYLSFNTSIYSELTCGKFNGLFDPVKFFDELYRRFELYNKFNREPLKFDAYKRNCNFSDEQKDYLESILHVLISSNEKANEDAVYKDETPKETIAQKLKIQLLKYGFFQLEKVKTLENPERLVNFIANQDLPYQIAMFDYLDFLKHIMKEYAGSEAPIAKRNKIVSEICGKNVDGVKNNINYLYKQHPTGRYTSSLHIETVKNDYNNM